MLLLVVLLGAFFVSKSCGSSEGEVSQEEAVEIARENAPFEACTAPTCVRVRFLQRGLPIRGYWLVGLSDKPNADDPQSRTQSFLIDGVTGEVSAP